MEIRNRSSRPTHHASKESSYRMLTPCGGGNWRFSMLQKDVATWTQLSRFGIQAGIHCPPELVLQQKSLTETGCRPLMRACSRTPPKGGTRKRPLFAPVGARERRFLWPWLAAYSLKRSPDGCRWFAAGTATEPKSTYSNPAAVDWNCFNASASEAVSGLKTGTVDTQPRHTKTKLNNAASLSLETGCQRQLSTPSIQPRKCMPRSPPPSSLVPVSFFTTAMHDPHYAASCIP
eukprot:3337616-Rhodomonas_salina.1